MLNSVLTLHFSFLACCQKRKCQKREHKTILQSTATKLRRSACQSDKLPWSWCQCWAGWRECSCLLKPVWFLCTQSPGSWGGGRAGKAGHLPSPGLPRSSYLHDSNTTTYREARNPALLYHMCIFGYKIWGKKTFLLSSSEGRQSMLQSESISTHCDFIFCIKAILFPIHATFSCLLCFVLI